MTAQLHQNPIQPAGNVGLLSRAADIHCACCDPLCPGLPKDLQHTQHRALLMNCSISSGCASLKQAQGHCSYWIKANAYVVLRNTSKALTQGLQDNPSFCWRSGLQKHLLQACPALVGWSLLRHLPLMKRSSVFYKLVLKIHSCVGPQHYPSPPHPFYQSQFFVRLHFIICFQAPLAIYHPVKGFTPNSLWKWRQPSSFFMLLPNFSLARAGGRTVNTIHFF